jgi:hypothetical protein
MATVTKNRNFFKWPKLLNAGHNFGRRTTQESFQQSLVEISPVVSEEDFFLISSPFFLICIIGQNRQKFKVHKKSDEDGHHSRT